jgi:hypothetical protein
MIERADMSNVEGSAAQKDQRQRFREANDHAQSARADEKLRQLYEQAAAERRRSLYRVTFSDFFKGQQLASGLEWVLPSSNQTWWRPVKSPSVDPKGFSFQNDGGCYWSP